MSEPRSELVIREATEADAGAIIEIFRSAYGSDYMYPEFYEDTGVRRMILSDGTLMLVAEDAHSSAIVGTASVVLEIGAFSDLVGEFGRLAVLEEARSRGVGKLLMLGRLARVRDRLHAGVVEARTAHPFSCRIASRYGFAPVGVLPNKLMLGEGPEHAVIYIQYFRDALDLRKNHPRIIPEVYDLAAQAMANVGLDVDVVIDEKAAPYPHGGEFEIEELEEGGYSSLLRIERGRVRKREVFGPLKLHYGFFKLEATQAHYLIARERGRLAGAIGFIHDRHEHHVRIFELIPIDDAAVRPLLAELDRRSRDEWGVATVEVDVRAEAPRMQRTLLELGYRPVCYLPAYSFHNVERLDVVKMWRLLQPVRPDPAELPEDARALADLVLGGMRHQRLLPRIREAMHRVQLCSGLTEEQVTRLQGLVEVEEVEAGERLFGVGEPSHEMYIVMTGRISIVGSRGEIGSVRPGECVGEVALLAGGPHSATAVVEKRAEVGVLTRDGLRTLVRERPDIGVGLYRNLARELGDKLRRADLRDPADV